MGRCGVNSLIIALEKEILGQEPETPSGAALEAIVIRLKMLACKSEMKSSSLAQVRFLAISATIPNIGDFGLGEEMRPVKLTTKVLGCTPAKNDFLLEKVKLFVNLPCVHYHDAQRDWSQMNILLTLALPCCGGTGQCDNGALQAHLIKKGMVSGVFEEMGRTASAESWKALISGFVHDDRFKAASSAFQEMVVDQQVHCRVLKANYSINLDVASSSLEAYTKCGDLGKAEKVFQLLEACIHWGLGNEDKRFFKSMSIVKELQNIATGDTLRLHGKYHHHNLQLGELEANRILELEPNDASVYVTLSNMYCQVGRVADAIKRRELMALREVKNEPGYSWLESPSHCRLRRYPKCKLTPPQLELGYCLLFSWGKLLLSKLLSFSDDWPLNANNYCSEKPPFLKAYRKRPPTMLLMCSPERAYTADENDLIYRHFGSTLGDLTRSSSKNSVLLSKFIIRTNPHCVGLTTEVPVDGLICVFDEADGHITLHNICTGQNMRLSDPAGYPGDPISSYHLGYDPASCSYKLLRLIHPSHSYWGFSSN
ncbi:OLC1v1006070C1 [Oldenlandia corymbosa var. corymbosa]|uniref:OLC1v1006070C1 n=1 Tax=Oldenlandia corymbosa var. corymbosa TaxID=529605 RepID=A0AAV1DG23_OLDCO|nr:OLC1v1006070C1 [Oldenlandia corymbosa var. corymbosa]